MAHLPPHVGLTFTKTIHHDINPSIDPTKSDLSQPSKVILITGAGRGIGRSIALRYADTGVACLILCARTASQLDEVSQAIHAIHPDVKVRTLALDVTDEEQVSLAAEKIKEEEGRLDVLVNNAGVSSPWLPITESDVLGYWKVWEVHLKGTYVMLRAFLPLLVETAKMYETKVDVVNVSSIGAHVSIPGASAYQTSKFALLRLSEFVCIEYEKMGVNCIAIHPGGVVTDLSRNNKVIQASKSCRLSCGISLMLVFVCLLNGPFRLDRYS
jgi:NAD(P)-dependent dehydrogenase (short-subunit alcohol dehydrogenase family)